MLMWELRPVPGSSVASILDRLDQLVVQAAPKDLSGINIRSRIETRQTAEEPVFSGTSGPAVNLIHELTSISKGQCESYGSEAGFFQDAGVPTIIIGPDDILQAHKIDEYIELDQLVAGIEFLNKLECRLRRNGLNQI